MRGVALLAGALTAPLLTGCLLKDPPEPAEIRKEAMPNLQPPPAWIGAAAAPGEVADQWLGTFGDSRLEKLVAEAIAYNPDLRVAAARVEQAKAYLKAAGSALYPQVNAIGKASGKSGDGGGIDFAGVFASWEIDLWGRARSDRKAAELQYFSTELDSEYARQSIAALVAKSWFLAIETRLQKELADSVVTASEKLVDLADERLRVGIGDEYDVAVSRSSLLAYQDTSRQLELALMQAVRALELLVGRYPAAELEVSAELGVFPGPVPAGLPSELLERRPDVVAAERRLAAAFYRVEEAKAARLPTITLTGNGSTISSDLVLLEERDDPVWGAGGRAVVPLYRGGALQAQVEVRTAEQKEAVAQYGKVGANAFAEVENALSASFTLDQREAILSQSVTENEKATELANVRYRVGSDDLRAVEQQQLRLFAARSSLLRVQTDRRVQRVNLHLALGGSFAERRAIAAADQ
jgi:NodT family efflux transporter outer membrane factor (OMF) lipoprotein